MKINSENDSLLKITVRDPKAALGGSHGRFEPLGLGPVGSVASSRQAVEPPAADTTALQHVAVESRHTASTQQPVEGRWPRGHRVRQEAEGQKRQRAVSMAVGGRTEPALLR